MQIKKRLRDTAARLISGAKGRVYEEGSACPYHAFKRMGFLRAHEIAGHELAKAVHKRSDVFHTVGFVRKTMEKLIGRAMIISDGEEWRQMNRILTRALSMKTVNDRVIPIAVEECNATIGKWKKDGVSKDVERDMLHMTGRITMRTLMSDALDEGTSLTVLDAIGDAIRQSSEPSGFIGKTLKKLGLPYGHVDFVPSLLVKAAGSSYDLPAPVPEAFRQATRAIDDILYPAIRARRGLDTQPDDVLGYLINGDRDGVPLDDDDIRDQLVMLIVAGHETTAFSIATAILEIAQDPAAQKALRDEFREVVGNREVRAEDYPKLEKTRSAFLAAICMDSPVQRAERQAVKDAVIGGVEFRKGDMVSTDWRGMLKDPATWERPGAFVWDRFVKKGSMKAFNGFGFGEKTCTGRNAALAEGTVALAKIFNALNVEVTQKPKGVRYYFTARMDGPFAARFTPRLAA